MLRCDRDEPTEGGSHALAAHASGAPCPSPHPGRLRDASAAHRPAAHRPGPARAGGGAAGRDDRPRHPQRHLAGPDLHGGPHGGRSSRLPARHGPGEHALRPLPSERQRADHLLEHEYRRGGDQHQLGILPG
ncbi:MAG: hypothetical protein DLM71_08520 [Chloroflexi bacterium]|nr:MAG: hypothetical protein DLM71_08520 [Chloroflexota bacterium]